MIVEDPIRTYIQWQTDWVDLFTVADGGGLVDCHIDSNWYVPGYESIKSRGVSFIRCTGRNAHFSNNASDGTIIEDMSLTFEDDCAYDELSAPLTRGLIEFSVNISGGMNTEVSQIIGLTIVQGRSDSTGWRHIGIVAAASACPVEVIGDYDTNFVNPKGLINMTAPAQGVDGSYDGLCARIAGTVDFRGMRFRGEAPNIWTGSTHELKRMVFRENGNVTLENCILDPGINGSGGSLTESDTLTNAEFDALHPGLP